MSDSLQLLSPISDARAGEAFGSAGRDELLESLTRLPFGREPLRRRAPRRRTLVLVLAFVAAGAIAATAWSLSRSQASETTSIECVIEGVDAIIPSSSGDPAADCAAEWKREEGTAAPPLAAYDNTFGGVTVLPKSETPPAGYRPLKAQDVALIELQESLDDSVSGLNASCLDGVAATRLAKQKLAEYGFGGWTVTVRSAAGSGACYDAEVIDPSSLTVTLIPIGSPATADPTVKRLADDLRPITQSCESLPAAVAAARSAAKGLSYRLSPVTDGSLRCARIYLSVGGTIFIDVRGPS